MNLPFGTTSISPVTSVRLRALFCAVAAALIGGAFVNFGMGRAANQSNREVVHQEKVIDQLLETLSTMKDAETGQRGFVLSGDDKYLEPYNSALAHIDSEIHALESQMEGSVLSAQQLKELKEAVNLKQDELEIPINLRRTKGIEAAIAYIRLDRGKAAMDRLRELIRGMVADETIELKRRQATAIGLAQAMTVTFAVTVLVNLAFLTWAYRRIVREMARRELVAKELLSQKELLAVTLKSIGDGVIVTDIETRVTFMNEVAEKLTGWTADEAVGRPCGSVFHIVNESTRQLVESPVEKVLKTGVTVGLANHTILIRRDGTELPIDDSGAPICEANGPVRGVVLVFRDFTEHKQAEQLLRHGEERYRALVTATAQVIWTTDADGQIIEDSPSWREFTGQTFEQWKGSGWLEVIHPDDREQAIRVWKEAVQTQSVYRNEYRIRARDGSYRWTAVRGVPVKDANGKIIEWVGMNMDITDRIDAEHRVREAKEAAEAANIAKDNFLATLSHELRTPLTPVVAMLTAWETDRRLPSNLIADIQMMRRNVDLEARLIDDLLDLTRIVRGKLSLNPEVANVHQLISSVAGMYQSEFHAKRLRFSMDLDATDHHVYADPARLQQVFLNLLKNATKFTPEGGNIDLQTKNGQDGRVEVTIHDNGIGMPDDLLQRLFVPFEQGSAETVRRYGGLGLGLSIAKALMNAQGGSISASSGGPGQGSTFTVGIPCVNAPDSEETPVPMPQPEIKPASLNILLVEDHADTARVMSRLLKNLGHQVSVAGTVSGAMETVAKDEFDVLLSDIGLPDGTGIDLIRQIRMRSQLPAIALTGFGMEEDVAKCREAGFDDHITKPVNFQRLEIVIRQLAERGRSEVR